MVLALKVSDGANVPVWWQPLSGTREVPGYQPRNQLSPCRLSPRRRSKESRRNGDIMISGDDTAGGGQATSSSEGDRDRGMGGVEGENVRQAEQEVQIGMRAAY